MAFNYGSIAQTAVNQIADKGRNVTYQTVTSGTYNPATSGLTGNGTSNSTIKAVVTEVRLSTKDDSPLQRGDKIFLITKEPNKKDRIIDESKTYQIMDFQTIRTGDTAIMYKVQGRI